VLGGRGREGPNRQKKQGMNCVSIPEGGENEGNALKLSFQNGKNFSEVKSKQISPIEKYEK